MTHMTLLVLIAFATARITRLIVADRITLAPRAWLLRKVGPDTMAGYLLTCAWCASVYVGGIMAVLWWLVGDHLAFQVPITGLALSYIAGFLAAREEG